MRNSSYMLASLFWITVTSQGRERFWLILRNNIWKTFWWCKFLGWKWFLVIDAANFFRQYFLGIRKSRNLFSIWNRMIVLQNSTKIHTHFFQLSLCMEPLAHRFFYEITWWRSLLTPSLLPPKWHHAYM